MIQEISKEELEDIGVGIFPDLSIYTEEGDDAHLEIKTLVEVSLEGHYTMFRKKLEYEEYINYVKLMEFIDYIMVEVNNIKKHFTVAGWEKNNLLCYKVVDYV